MTGVQTCALPIFCWMEQVPQNILLLRGNHEEEFLCYLELLLAVQEKRQLVMDESSSKDLEHLYQETKNLIEQHNRQTEQIRVFDHYGTLEELITEQCISMADLRRWAARMEAMPYFCQAIQVLSPDMKKMKKDMKKMKKVVDNLSHW